MPCQIHAPSSHSHPRTHEDADRQLEEDAEAQAAQAATTSDVTIEDADAWLADIDEALAENGSTSELAAAFVASFVNKGGQ